MEDGEREFTVDEALLQVGFGPYQYLILCYAGMGWFSEAMEVMILSFVGSIVQKKWNLSSQQDSFISTAVFIGMLIGAYSWGIVADKFGRRKAFFFSSLLVSVAGLLSAFAPNYTTLVIVRSLVGAGAGGGPVLFSWFLEFVPAPNRGKWMVVFYGFWTLGSIFESGLAWIVMPTLGWRWLLGLSSIPTFILPIFYIVTPESPRYLCIKGENSSAIRILQNMAARNGKVLNLGTVASKNDDPTSNGETRSVLGGFNGVLKSMMSLLSPQLIRSTLLLWVVFFCNSFSYYGLVLLTTELNKKHTRCDPLSSSNGDSSDDINYKYVFFISFAEIPGLLIAALIIDKYGRKFSLAALYLCAAICIMPLVRHMSRYLNVAALFGARWFITGTFTVVYIYAPEVYPTVVRTTGLGIASAVGRIGGMICPQVAVNLVEGCHQKLAVLLFVAVIVVAGVCGLFFKVETKGRRLVDNVDEAREAEETS